MSKRVNYFTGILLFGITHICFGQSKNYSLNGKIENIREGETVYLLKGEVPAYDQSKWIIIDSTVSRKNAFSFTGTIEEPDYYMIALKGNRWCTFLLEAGKIISIKGSADDLNSAMVTGSENTRLIKDFQKTQKPFVQKLNASADSAEAASSRNDTVRYNNFLLLNQNWVKKIAHMNKNVIIKYPKSFLALSKLNFYYAAFSNDFVMKFLKQLPPELKYHSIAKEIYYKKFQEKVELSKIKKFYDFQLFDTLKNKVSFDEYYGNYVLVDFWASWCKPCLANLPELKRIYSKFQSKNFKIISISIDETLSNWMKGINFDPVPWKHVSDLKGWQGLPVKFYKIESIPRYMILDPQGDIVTNDIPINSIDEKLIQIFRSQ